MANSPDILLGSLIGDALALGPHWIYNQREIREKLGRVTTYQPPLAIYHAGKSAGDFTHYGDQALVLLRSIVNAGGFDLARFESDWQAFWEDPATISYRDGATKDTLAHLRSRSSPASTSDDIAGAARIAPLFLLDWKDDDALLAAVRSQTAFTHGDPAVIEAAEFFTSATLAVQRGKSIKPALRQTLESGIWQTLPDEWLENALESAISNETDAAALHRHGLSCRTYDAFPSICHLLLRHPEDPATALIENANSGGDSAARGMILGLVYGAAFPVSTWPAEWLTGLGARHEIESLIRKLP
ncbi:MAG: ADP-ribosylglycohydrolase family protein [Verrucomicrobiota bacterium]